MGDFSPITKSNLTLYVDEGTKVALNQLKEKGISPSRFVEGLITKELKPIDIYSDVTRLLNFTQSNLLLHNNINRLLNKLIAENGTVRVVEWVSYLIGQEYLKTIRYCDTWDNIMLGVSSEHFNQIMSNVLGNVKRQEERNS